MAVLEADYDEAKKNIFLERFFLSKAQMLLFGQDEKEFSLLEVGRAERGTSAKFARRDFSTIIGIRRGGGERSIGTGFLFGRFKLSSVFIFSDLF